MSDQQPVEVTEAAQVERSEAPAPEATTEAPEATENKALDCAFCAESTELDLPESYAFDLKWVCPKCQGTNVLEGQGPAGVPEALREQTPHLQASPPPEEG